MSPRIVKTDQAWREQLDARRYAVLRQADTEPPFSGEYVNCHDVGVYQCAACGATLFDAETKFESGTGWPSFYAPVASEAVELRTDTSFGARRTEVLCAACESHLGHVFEDGPPPSGLRYCMNSLALRLDRSESSGA